jgi:DNA replication protein DnaC
MRRISEVLQGLSIPTNTGLDAISIEPEKHNCEICKDQRWLRVDVEPGHPNFGRLFPCECLVRERETRLSEQLLELSQLQSLADLTFEAFDSSVPGAAEAYEVAYAFARNPQGWLFLHGNCGVGKTHLAVAIALEVVRQKQVGVYFRVVPDLLDQLRATFDPTNGVAYDDRFQQIRNAHLLVLDDLGTEQATSWAKEKLYQLINHRYNEQLPTVVTSNQDFNRIEQRVLSRLLDTRLSQYIFLDTDDYRLRTARGQSTRHDSR